MVGDEKPQERPARVEALFRRSGSPGEQAAAGAAMDRPRCRPGNADEDGGPETGLQFSLPDMRSVRLFVAVCRKHGLRPFRYPRQRRMTVMARARERSLGRVVRAEFSQPQTQLEIHFQNVADYLIARHGLGRRRQRHRPSVATGPFGAAPCFAGRQGSRALTCVRTPIVTVRSHVRPAPALSTRPLRARSICARCPFTGAGQCPCGSTITRPRPRRTR